MRGIATMAIKTATAKASTDTTKKTPAAIASSTVSDVETKPSKQQTRIMDVVKAVGSEAYQKAFNLAEKALSAALDNDSEIAKLNSLIEVKRAGNTTVLLDLARECVRLTVKGKTARLKLAADLFRVCTEQAEMRASDAFYKAHPERKDEPFSKIAGSWFSIKSDFARGMENGLNPEKHADGTAFRNAWGAYKKEHPEAVSARGSSQQAKSAEQAPSKQLKASAEKAAKEMSPEMKAALTTLMTVLMGIDAEDEPEAIERLNACSSDIRELSVARAELVDEAEGVKTRRAPAPARERDTIRASDAD